MIASVGMPVIVTTAGTPVAVVDFLAVSSRRSISIHGIMFQALPANTGKIYIGTRNMDQAMLTNLFAILPIPTDNFLPTFSCALTIAPNGLALETFYVDAENSGEGVIVTYLQT